MFLFLTHTPPHGDHPISPDVESWKFGHMTAAASGPFVWTKTGRAAVSTGYGRHTSVRYRAIPCAGGDERQIDKEREDTDSEGL